MSQQTDICRFSYECRECHQVKTFDLSFADVCRWKGGELIQNVFPQLSEGDRELMISGNCGECFDEMFESMDDLPDDYAPAF
jgi:hypothetical protein